MALPSKPVATDTDELPSQRAFYSHGKKSRKKRRAQGIEENFSSVDEVPDFQDPFSELNLFLFKHLKRSLPNLGFPKRWTLGLQDGLIHAITPEFKKKFPLYRLGVTALKKAFEKLLAYSEVVEHEKEAFSQDGKLRISFLIKENLKHFHYFTPPSYLKPYHLAHQLAMKIGECLAVVDGRRPKIDTLAKTVWSILRHLLKGVNPHEVKSPYDDYDGLDQLIVKIILENTTKDPTISEHDLQLAVKETLHTLSQLPAFSSTDAMRASISALLAEKLSTNPALLNHFSLHERQAAGSFIRKHIAACRKASPSIERMEIALRSSALYTLAINLPKNLTEQEIKEAARVLYPIQQENRPPLGQALYAFFAAEIILKPAHTQTLHPEEMIAHLTASYKAAIRLPKIVQHDLLETLIWKEIGDSEQLLNTLSYLVGQRIEGEIANLLLDNPKQSFAQLVSHTTNLFKRFKEFAADATSDKIEGKIRLWTLQSDMLQRWIQLDENTPLIKIIKKSWNTLSKHTPNPSHEMVIHSAAKAYLHHYPQMVLYSAHLHTRITTLYKYCFFCCFGTQKESSFDRFIAWHTIALKEAHPHLSQEELHLHLEEILSKRVPLLPLSLLTSA